MKFRWKRFLLALCGVLAVLLLVVGGAIVYSSTYSMPKQAASIENHSGLVQARGRSLYDSQGNRLQLKGINAGQILLQEGWMSPFALEPLKNEDGSFVTDDDGNLQYPEFTESQFRAALKENPNLQDQDMDVLLQQYYSCFFTEEDFRLIREELQMNTIRLPFYYLNILNEDLTLREEEEAFSYLDWFITQAAKYELYVVLDLHGAPGSQSGYEHSGSMESAGLWEHQENRDAAVELWKFVSRHYTLTRPDLGCWIAAYDLLNEPTYEYRSVTTKECWDFFDVLYDTIRANGDNHVITMMGCWDFSSLPDPEDYGWENVQYEYHWYNWWSDVLPYSLFFAYQDLSNIGRDYDVPVLIGEFTAFESKENWQKTFDLFDRRGYSWTIWNYKTTVTGWWTSSWGVYTCQLNLTDMPKCNVASCTYEEFLDACEATRTENCATGTLWEVLTDYNGRKEKS